MLVVIGFLLLGVSTWKYGGTLFDRRTRAALWACLFENFLLVYKPFHLVKWSTLTQYRLLCKEALIKFCFYLNHQSTINMAVHRFAVSVERINMTPAYAIFSVYKVRIINSICVWHVKKISTVQWNLNRIIY